MSYSSINITDHTLTALLERSSVYELLSLSLKVSSEGELAFIKELLHDLPGARVWEELLGADEAAELLGSTEGSAASASDLTHHFEQLSLVDLQPVMNGLFQNEEIVSLRESSYENNEFARTRLLADIAGFYKAWSLDVGEGTSETLDSLPTELEFMCLLLRREVFARAKGMEEQAATTSETASTFFSDHLGRYYCAAFSAIRQQFGNIVDEFAQLPDTEQLAWEFLNLIAILGIIFLNAERDRMNVSPEQLSRRKMVAEADKVECMSPSEPAQ